MAYQGQAAPIEQPRVRGSPMDLNMPQQHHTNVTPESFTSPKLTSPESLAPPKPASSKSFTFLFTPGPFTSLYLKPLVISCYNIPSPSTFALKVSASAVPFGVSQQ
ncbi:hypothetical protein D9611_012340 [Ephemerocybe angulata]|uniref:Uncharacterized protein n=1 Tax=Ephemerocybe angulata TaxID=980116 RepID=A0A8H5FK26_9AGAR|nr:hypothetical protein D9611_012340 [Tulosesus angulatus]